MESCSESVIVAYEGLHASHLASGSSLPAHAEKGLHNRGIRKGACVAELILLPADHVQAS